MKDTIITSIEDTSNVPSEDRESGAAGTQQAPYHASQDICVQGGNAEELAKAGNTFQSQQPTEEPETASVVAGARHSSSAGEKANESHSLEQTAEPGEPSDPQKQPQGSRGPHQQRKAASPMSACENDAAIAQALATGRSKPKRAKTPYELFLSEFRGEHKEMSDMKEVRRAAREIWDQMDTTQRERFKEKSQQLQQQAPAEASAVEPCAKSIKKKNPVKRARSAQPGAKEAQGPSKKRGSHQAISAEDCPGTEVITSYPSLMLTLQACPAPCNSPSAN